MEFPTKTPSIDRTYCCVPGCKSLAQKRRDLAFHKFPSVTEKVKVALITKKGCILHMSRRKAWEYQILLGKPITNSMMVCSLHFLKDDYILPDFRSKRHCLNRNAVPSQNLPKRLDDAKFGTNSLRTEILALFDTEILRPNVVIELKTAEREAVEALLLLSSGRYLRMSTEDNDSEFSQQDE